MFKNSKKPIIKSVTVTVQKPPVKTSTPSRRPDSDLDATPNATKRPPPPKNRYELTTVAKKSNANRLQTPDRQSPARTKSLAVKPSHRKRKTDTPTSVQWGSSSSEDESEAERSSKRQKTGSPMDDFRRTLQPDRKRRIRDVDNKGEQLDMIQGIDMTNGEHAKEFQAAFSSEDAKFVVELQYPSLSLPERFETVVRGDPQEWNPLQDIEYSIEEILANYLPSSIAAPLQSETDGIVRRLKRAVTKDSPKDYKATLAEFNQIINDALPTTIPAVLDDMHSIPLSLVRRIVNQVYQRTVSPKAHLLRRVKDKATTYGELLPPFVHNIFDQTQLNSSKVFVDLGSGVGNVVLQSALQTGAESWGIEIMDTAAKFATAQADELKARARLWNLSLGPLQLLHGSFLESPEIDAVLRRADVVLVNNKVFPQKLNGTLLDKFLDLKDGCKVVSLESFTPGKTQGVRNEQNVASLFDEEEFNSGTYSVSWTGDSVDYYIATKLRELEGIVGEM